MRLTKHIINFVLIIVLSAFLSSCQKKIKGASQSADKIEQMQEERRKEDEKQYKLAQKRHMDIQTKETRKRMKQSRKRAERLMAGKPEDPFLKRLFKPKLKKSKPKPQKT